MGAKQITHLVFLDLETTALRGPDSNADAVIEVAASRVRLVDRVVEDQFHTLIKPWGDQSGDMGDNVFWDLGDYHRKAGHFAGVNWEEGLDYSLALDILEDRFLTEGATLAGQNPGFDIRHLERDFSQLGRPWPKLDYHRIDLCSPAMFLVMAGITDGVSLRNVIPWAYGQPDRKQAHRAMGDVDDAIRVFWAMFDWCMNIRPRMPDPAMFNGPSTEDPVPARVPSTHLEGTARDKAMAAFGPCPIDGCPNPRAKNQLHCLSHTPGGAW